MNKIFQNCVNNLFALFVVCIAVNNVSSINKRSDIELQSCIENFDVHKDKIIRTQDSRNMGAKYLNEIDLGSREECLRLCCETETCDVFVYEEKSPGSCYLFHCGPPEDFKCKFTRHANYSSAVLTVNRHLNELENQIKLTKHEQDLTRLRNPDDSHNRQETNQNIEATKIIPTQTTSTTTTKSNVVKEILPQVDATKSVIGRRCSRYQFECRTSGECIAIYNACDGIPQCADGSDEAPELGCPELATTVAPSPPPPPLQLPIVHSNDYGQTNQLRKSLPPLIVDNSYQQSPIIQSNPRLPASVDISRDNTDFLRPPAPDINRVQPVVQQNSYNEAQIIQQPQQPFIAPRPSNNNNWIPHPNNQMPVLPQNVQYADKNSHIFNHKENGLQVVDTPDSGNSPPYADMNVRNDFPKIPNYYGDIYRPQYQIPENWQQNRQQINPDVNPYINNDNWQPVQVPQNQQINPDQTNPGYQQNIDIKPNWKQDLINTQAESKAYDHTIIKEPKNFEQHEAPHKEPIQESKLEHDEHKDHVHHDKKHDHAHISSAEELKQNVEDLIDGESERPGGAVLSLTLGVCLTCVMAVLIGCRLRVVRRRMRRGGKSPYAHDADYLVNGMYL